MSDDKIIYEFIKKLKNNNDKDALTAIHKRLINEGYKIKAKHKGLGFDIKYSIKSGKPIVAVLYKKNKDSDFEIHMRPFHVALYANHFSELSEHIEKCCTQGKDCTNCGYCDKAYEYEYKGISYKKCQFICYNFCFSNIEESDISSILKVLNMELQYIH